MRANLPLGRSAVFLAALLGCALVASGQGTAPAALQAQAVAPNVDVGTPEPSVNYRLAPKDTVHIKVFQEDDLETTARIGSDGNIFFPLLGKAHITGETVQEATATMEKLLNYYLVNPQVSVEIVAYAKQHFTILGQVNRPGIYDMPDEGTLNVLEAIATAGGYTKVADPHHITIKRIVNGQETVLPNVDGIKLLDPKGTLVIPAILPGDTISVRESMF